MLKNAVLCAVLFTTTAAQAQDPVQTDSDKYKVILENDRVRVLEYRDNPGGQTAQHRHPAFVLYTLTPFTRELTLPDDKVLRRDFKAGEAFWSEAQTHVGKNVGTTPTHIIMIEMK